MILFWAVPVVAAATATLVVLARARAAEEAARDLAAEVAVLSELRAPLAEVRRSIGETETRVGAFRAAHPPADHDAPGG